MLTMHEQRRKKEGHLKDTEARHCAVLGGVWGAYQFETHSAASNMKQVYHLCEVGGCSLVQKSSIVPAKRERERERARARESRERARHGL